MSPGVRSWLDRAWRGLLLGTMTLFVVNVGLMIAAVATSSFARRWLGTWLPEGWTTNWYTAAWKEFQLGSVLWVTVEVVLAVVLLALIIGVPAAYTLARREGVDRDGGDDAGDIDEEEGDDDADRDPP